MLALTGIYGVIAYSVAQRKAEIGIRVALGATRRKVILLAIRAGLAPAILGTILGLILAFASTRLLSTMLFEVKPFDLDVWGGASLMLVVVATVASYIPARRATAIDPTIALRAE